MMTLVKDHLAVQRFNLSGPLHGLDHQHRLEETGIPSRCSQAPLHADFVLDKTPKTDVCFHLYLFSNQELEDIISMGFTTL